MNVDRRHRPPASLVAVAIAIIAPWGGASALNPMALEFVTHAAFFSREAGVADPLDPQVFVRDPSAQEGAGPQNIRHIAGYRPLLLRDPPDAKLFTAEGRPLPFSASQWLRAGGRVVITPSASGGTDVVATFTALAPGGVYSLFENHFDVKPTGFTPLDGTGSANSFAADSDGSATVKLHAPDVPTSVNAVLLVYHSDGKSHGQSRGTIGTDAHHHLIAKIP